MSADTRVPPDLLIRGGTVISMDPEVGARRRADVLISDGRIAAIDEALEVGDATAIDASEMVVLPGLVDSHRHLFYAAFRGAFADMSMPVWRQEFLPRVAGRLDPDDVYRSTLLGAVDALNYGITTVLDWCSAANSPEHADSAVAALRDSGVRAVFGHGSSIRSKLGLESAAEGWSSAKRLRDSDLADDDGQIKLALALLGPEQSSWDATETDIAVARELGVPMSMHIGGRRPAAMSIQQLRDRGLLGPDMNFSHCCATTDDELRMLADAGATATASPSAEFMMGSGTPASGRMRDAGLRLALGADSVCCASGDLFQEARAALAAERILRAARVFAEDGNIEATEQLGLSTTEVLEAITIGGAHACWLGDEVGSLTVGKRADVILVRKTDLNVFPGGDIVGTLVCSGNGSNVDTVLVGGRIVKKDNALVGIDFDRVRDEAVAARDRVYALTAYPGIAP